MVAELVRVSGNGELRKQVLRKTSGRISHLLEGEQSESEREDYTSRVKEPEPTENEAIETVVENEFNEDREDVLLRQQLKAKFSLDPDIANRFKTYYHGELRKNIADDAEQRRTDFIKAFEKQLADSKKFYDEME